MKPSLDVYGIGHALVDMEWSVDDAFLTQAGLEKGRMTLVDFARQEELMALLAGTAPRRGAGGSAANSLYALARLGSRGFFSCRVAGDETGAFFAGELLQHGVENDLHQHPRPGHTGRCLVLITPDAERTLCTCLGASEEFAQGDLIPQRLSSARWLYVEGYLVTNPVTLETAAEAVRLARQSGVKVALTCSDVSMVRFFRAGLEGLLEGGVDLLFANADEACALADSRDLSVALQRLEGMARQGAVTLGRDGAALWEAGKRWQIPGLPVTAVDTNGAGDIFAGTFLHGLCQNWTVPQAGEFACRAAARLVTQRGARLSPDDMDSLRRTQPRNLS
ncbi:MAG: adenosine kinase [Magnetococcus sp. WYHC-3]